MANARALSLCSANSEAEFESRASASLSDARVSVSCSRRLSARAFCVAASPICAWSRSSVSAFAASRLSSISFNRDTSPSSAFRAARSAVTSANARSSRAAAAAFSLAPCASGLLAQTRNLLVVLPQSRARVAQRLLRLRAALAVRQARVALARDHELLLAQRRR